MSIGDWISLLMGLGGGGSEDSCFLMYLSLEPYEGCSGRTGVENRKNGPHVRAGRSQVWELHSALCLTWLPLPAPT